MELRPGRLVWAKVGDWPWWPARIVSLDEVPEKVVGALGTSDKGTIVKFFEDPPKYQRVLERSLRPWRAHYQVLSQEKGKPFAQALEDANEYFETLSVDLQDDGVVSGAGRGGGGRGRKAAKVEESGVVASSTPLLENDVALLAARRELGAALMAGNSEAARARAVLAAAALCRFAPSERAIRELELGKIASILSNQSDPALARAGCELVAHLSGLLVMQRVEHE